MPKRNDFNRKSNNNSGAARKPATTTSTAPVSTQVRNSPVPRAATPAKTPLPRAITREMIEVRAYEIWQRGQGGSEIDHWYQAERELRNGQ